MIRLLLFTFVLAFGALGHSQTQEVSPEERAKEVREAEIAVKVKKRLYPGGRDEEDLKVQSQVATPTRKFAPQADVREENSEE